MFSLRKSHHARRCPIFCPKSSEDPEEKTLPPKKGHHFRRCPIFRPKSSKDRKKLKQIKKSLRPQAVVCTDTSQKFFVEE